MKIGAPSGAGELVQLERLQVLMFGWLSSPERALSNQHPAPFPLNTHAAQAYALAFILLFVFKFMGRR